MKDVFSIRIRLHNKLGYRASNHSRTLSSPELISPAALEFLHSALYAWASKMMQELEPSNSVSS